jgi:hypothetical protein
MLANQMLHNIYGSSRGFILNEVFELSKDANWESSYHSYGGIHLRSNKKLQAYLQSLDDQALTAFIMTCALLADMQTNNEYLLKSKEGKFILDFAADYVDVKKLYNDIKAPYDEQRKKYTDGFIKRQGRKPHEKPVAKEKPKSKSKPKTKKKKAAA